MCPYHVAFLFSPDVVAYVEVRTGADNRSKAIVSKLRQLGASVEGKLCDKVTHVIWKDGKKSTVDRARKRGIPVVTVLWVERFVSKFEFCTSVSRSVSLLFVLITVEAVAITLVITRECLPLRISEG